MHLGADDGPWTSGPSIFIARIGGALATETRVLEWG